MLVNTRTKPSWDKTTVVLQGGGEAGWRITCSAHALVLHVFLLLFVLAALRGSRDLSSRPGIGAASSAVKSRLLTTGQPGNPGMCFSTV